MKHPLTRIIAAAIAILSFASIPALVFAEDENNEEPAPPSTPQLQISPVSNRVTLVAGETKEYEIKVKSPEDSGQSARFRVYATPYYVTNEAYELSFSADNVHTQMCRWIQLQNPDESWVSEGTYSIEPGEEKIVKYRIPVPEDVAAGGQYATIFVEGINDDVETEGSAAGIRTISRAGIVVYGTTNGDTHEEAEVTDYRFDTFLTGGNLTAEARVTNRGNTDFTSTYTYTVKNLFGKELYQDKVSKPVLPDTTWHMQTEWEETPFMGIFQVSYKVTAPNATRDETKIVVILPIIVMIIGILLLTTIIIWIILFIRKRRERKSRLLV